MVRLGSGRVGAGILARAVVCGTLLAAGQEVPAGDGPVHTLHVYMDLIQVPVLVVSPWLEPMKPVDPRRFLVSLDSGPKFRPKHVRQEGDDPIALGILLDLNGDQDGLMPRIDDAVAGLAPELLHVEDHVSVYARDCNLTRTLQDVPAQAERLRRGVDHALEPWLAWHQERRRPPCTRRVQLWDAVAAAVRELGELPGRRVLLVVTDGADHGSAANWNELKLYAQTRGVAIFGLKPHAIEANATNMGRAGLLTKLTFEDQFTMVCELSGGIVMKAGKYDLKRQLAKFATLVRDRYIVEFSRPRDDSPGEHSILVTIAKIDAVILPAGVSVGIPDPGLMADPTTIPRDVTDAPEMGKRKVLKPSN